MARVAKMRLKSRLQRHTVRLRGAFADFARMSAWTSTGQASAKPGLHDDPVPRRKVCRGTSSRVGTEVLTLLPVFPSPCHKK
jgi:hypothetical protein